MNNETENTTNTVDDQKTISRRRFLKTLVIGTGGMTFLCSGLGIAAISKPRAEFFSALQENAVNATNKVLVAYGSVCGSTGEIAKAIANELQISGLPVDVLPVQNVKDLSGYKTIVLGSANRMGRLCQPTRQFIDKFDKDIALMQQTAYFDVGLTMKEDTPENREEALAYLQPMIDIKQPFSMETFGGKLDLSKIEYGLQIAMKNDTSGTMEEGDFRNWEKISAWGKQLAMQLQAA